nr:hypothetical protein [Tanacetum cinerariifolium]
EVSPPEEVPITTVPGGNQAAKTVAVELHVVRESRKRGHEGIDANAPPKIQARELEIKNLEVLLETEAGIKMAVEEKSVGMSQELERMRAQFSELQ